MAVDDDFVMQVWTRREAAGAEVADDLALRDFYAFRHAPAKA